MAAVIDSYSESNQDQFSNLQTGGNVKIGQSFTGNGNVVSGCKFYLKKTGTPTGNAVATLYAHSGTFGTSSIATGSALITSDTFDVSTLTTSAGLVTFNFSTTYTTVNGTNYVIACEFSGAASVNIGRDDTSPTHAGNFMSNTGSSWVAFSAVDLCFYVLGDPLPVHPNEPGNIGKYILVGDGMSRSEVAN